MLNQQALDSLYSATYMEDYLDCMENLPDDIQRYISRMRDLDIQYSDYMQELETSMEELLTELDKKEPTDQRKRAVHREELQKKKWKAQESLMKAQDIGDEKLQLAQNVQDNVENKARQLELDKKNLGELTKLRPREYGREMESQDPVKDDRNIKRARRARHEVYVPSIMGPSTLEVTSFVDSNSHDTHPSTSTSKSAQVSQVVVEKQPSARSQAAAEKAAANTAAVKLEPVYENPKAGSSSQVEVEPTRTTGRGSERGGGSSTRAAAVEKVEPEVPSSSKAVERPAAASTNTVTPKKQTQKAQTNEKKYKKRKTKQTRNHDTSPPEQIDPDEPTYCLCDQVSYGEMIGCDNDLCPIEWFHFSCVNLTHKPKGKWYCPKCRGEKPNIMKPKAIFLKELEKYNREKEGNA